MKALYKAIYDKFFADATLKGYVYKSASDPGCYSIAAPASSGYPYIVYKTYGSPIELLDNSSLEEIEVEFIIYDNNKSNVNMLDIATALKSCFRDCTLTISGYSNVTFALDDYFPDQDEETKVWEYHAVFRLIIA